MNTQLLQEVPHQHWAGESSGSNQKIVPSIRPRTDELVMVVRFPQYWDGVNLD
jgi:hypothetical protein